MSNGRPGAWWTKVTRDLVMFTVGVGLVVFEAVIRAGPPRESLLVIYGAMMGLPAIIRADEARRANGDRNRRDTGSEDK